MTWNVDIAGHGASPEEEAELRRRVRSFVERLRADIVTELTAASFSGSYGAESFLEQAEGGEDDAADAEAE